MRRIIGCAVTALFVFSVAFAGEVHEAAKNGDIAKMKALLDKDPSLLYVQDEQGKTPLHWATGRGQLEAMRVLLDEYHVDVNVRNKNGGTPLHVAASQAKPEGAKILIAHQATIDARAHDEATPLHYACAKGKKEGHIATAKLLIEHGANVNAKNNKGLTPLAMALYRDNTQIIALLRAHGAKGGSDMRRGRAGMQQFKPRQEMDSD